MNGAHYAGVPRAIPHTVNNGNVNHAPTRCTLTPITILVGAAVHLTHLTTCASASLHTEPTGSHSLMMLAPGLTRSRVTGPLQEHSKRPAHTCNPPPRARLGLPEHGVGQIAWPVRRPSAATRAVPCAKWWH